VVTQIRKRQLCHGGSYKGINYYPGADKPYLVTTGDDKTVKIWVYLSKSYQRLFHPDLPIDISGSEGGTVRVWNSGIHRIENTLHYTLERAWCFVFAWTQMR
jgi:coatomer subunit beta'